MQDSQDKLNFKQVLPIFVIVLVDLLGLTIIIPLLPLYAAAFGADALMVGALGTAYPLMQLIGSPLLGGLSDRYGRKPVLIASQIGTFSGFILLGFANALPLLFISRIIDGLSGANIVAAQAAITDSTNERTRAQGLGLIGAAFGLGFTLGPAIGGIALALTNNNYQVPAFIAATFSFISIMLTTFWFKETLTPEKRQQAEAHRAQTGSFFNRLSSALKNPVIGVLLLLMFSQQLVFGAFENLIPLFTLSRLGLNASGNALVFVFVGFILVLVQGKYIGPWSRRFGERRVIYAGLALLAVGLILVSITPHQPVQWYSKETMTAELANSGDLTHSGQIAVPLPDDTNTGWTGLGWMLVAMIPTTMGAGVLSPSINSLITKRSPSTQTGGILGVSSALNSGAHAIAPVAGGAIFQFFGSTAPFMVGGLILLVLLILAIQKVSETPEEKIALASPFSG